jgi:hypothetical protein
MAVPGDFPRTIQTPGYKCNNIKPLHISRFSANWTFRMDSPRLEDRSHNFVRRQCGMGYFALLLQCSHEDQAGISKSRVIAKRAHMIIAATIDIDNRADS